MNHPRYIPSFLSLAEQEALLASINGEAWLEWTFRREQHYGHQYDYAAPLSGDRKLKHLGPLPSWSNSVVERMISQGIMSRPPNQLLVKLYAPGEGIGSHVDCLTCFDSHIAILSLGSSCEMRLTHPQGEVVNLTLEPGSVLVLEDEFRFKWSHGIVAGGFPKGTRTSLVFRKVNPQSVSP